jgi:hypothetical protein
MSTVEELIVTRGAFRPAPNAVIRLRLGRSMLIGNVFSLIMIPPRETPRRIQSAYLIRFVASPSRGRR